MVRLIDVLFALSTHEPGTRVPPDGRSGHPQRRLPLLILLICLVCLLSLGGCAGLAVSASHSPVEDPPGTLAYSMHSPVEYAIDPAVAASVLVADISVPPRVSAHNSTSASVRRIVLDATCHLEI